MPSKKNVAISALFATILSTSQGEAGSSDAISSKEVSKEEMDCGLGASPMRVAVRHIEPNGIGYHQGYTTAEGFFSLYDGWDKWVFFLDTRVHVFNNGQPAVNAGLGTRYLAASRAWGINTYYDYRKTNRFHYNQVGAGFESLGKIWDFRLNGYAPVGKWTSPNYRPEFAYFQGNYAIVDQKYEYALGGFNAEAAAHVDTWKNYPLYFAAGPYYLHGSGGTTWGGQARASVRIYDYFKVEGNVSYDHLFKWIGQGQVSLNFSFGKKKTVRAKGTSCSTALALSSRAYQPVDRFEIVPVDTNHRYSTAINPATGQPFFFTFVDNTSSSLGTYESPYATLVAAHDNSGPDGIIYVFPGDGTSAGMNAGIVLQTNQKLWGSVVAQNLSTTIGNITIPAQSSGGVVNGVVVTPVITNGSDETVVTVVSGNEISGFSIQNVGSSSTAIANLAEATDLSVLNCAIAGPSSVPYAGIGVENLAGTLTVNNCTINEDYGIYIFNASTNLVANISNSNFNGGADGSVYWFYTGPVQGTLNLENCTINSGSECVYIQQATGSSMAATLNNNTMTSTNQGVYMQGAGTSSQVLSMTGNTILSQNQSVYIIQTDSVSATLSENTLTSFANSTHSFELDSNAGSTNAVLHFTNNTIASQFANSVYFNQSAGAVTAYFDCNTILAYDGGSGLSVNMATDATSYALSFNNNTVNGGEYGFYVDQAVGSFTVTGNNNTIVAPYDGYAAYLTTSGSASSHTFAFNNSVINGSEYGMYMDMGVGTVNVTFNDSTVIGASDYAVYIDQSEGALNLAVNNSELNAEEYAIYVAESAGTLHAALNDNTMVTGSDDYTVYFDLTGGTSQVAVNGNTLVGYYSLIVDQSSAASCDFSFTNNTLLAAAYGPLLNISAGTNTVTISGNTIIAGSPVTIEHMGGTLNLTMTDNELISSNSYGYSSSVTGSGTTSTQTISGNTITSSGGSPIRLDYIATGGTFTTTITDNTLSSSTYAVVSALDSPSGTQTLDLLNNIVTNSGGFNLSTAAGATTLNVNGNEFTSISTTPVNAAATSSSATVCMQLNDNAVYPTSSANAYILNGTGAASFTLNTPSGNTGNTNMSRTDVTIGTCP